MGSPTFTVFIPTYNRSGLLPRALSSIEAQTYRDFEVVIVDDGSSDDTAAVVDRWKAGVEFPVTYVKQNNQGKHAAHNKGVELAKGRLFFNLDSDDRLLPNTLERIRHHWESLPEGERGRFAGVEGLVESMDGERPLTIPYPHNPLDASFLDVRYRLGRGGDKKHAIRTEIARRFPYPVFSGERHIRPSLTWKRISHDYVFRCVNEPFQQVEYQTEGLSSDRFRLRMRNPRGFQLYYLEDVTLHRPWLSRRQLRRSMVDFIRFSLHAGAGIREQGRLTGYDPLWLALAPAGFCRWLVDLYRLRFKEGYKPNRKETRN
ncbi:glycosyltransferase family 2 protein [Methylocaldum sp.]|uniref:glycosyltransferase family A protein n=1 Tax=Methylocaldum sp. TaxID=1969727 RepID=UPI002D57F10D|nr:glycosyltransferase family 2 protein [Methylocaldum sp.]HYE34974.1 glycosyltransferase family 2 protein [Methylocaldum sp.]